VVGEWGPVTTARVMLVWLCSNPSPVTPHRCPLVLSGVAQGVARVNDRAVSRAARVGRVAVLPVDFTMAGGEVTATMKLRRSVIEAKHAAVVEVGGQGLGPGLVGTSSALRLGSILLGGSSVLHE
jgi:hypothetical protein